MAEKVDMKTILENVTLVQKGKVVTGEPTADNYAVYPKKGSPLSVLPGTDVLKILQAAYPKSVFTWFAKSFEPKEASKETSKK